MGRVPQICSMDPNMSRHPALKTQPHVERKVFTQFFCSKPRNAHLVVVTLVSTVSPSAPPASSSSVSPIRLAKCPRRYPARYPGRCSWRHSFPPSSSSLSSSYSSPSPSSSSWFPVPRTCLLHTSRDACSVVGANMAASNPNTTATARLQTCPEGGQQRLPSAYNEKSEKRPQYRDEV